MKSTALPRWKYGNPEDICDGLIAETARLNRQVPKVERYVFKDAYYRQAKSIHIKALVKSLMRNGGSWGK